MGKMTVAEFDPYAGAPYCESRWWSTRLDSSGKPTCEGCGKDLDPKTAIYLGPIGLPGADGKLYCGYGCVEVPQEIPPLKEQLDKALARAMMGGGADYGNPTLAEAVMEVIRPMVDLLVEVSHSRIVTFAAIKQVVEELGLEPAEKE